MRTLKQSNRDTGEFARVLEKYKFDADEFHVVHTQDVEPIIEAIKYIPEMTNRTKLGKASMRHIGTLPNIIALNIAKESGTVVYSREWKEVAVKKIMHDPDYKHFRVQY